MSAPLRLPPPPLMLAPGLDPGEVVLARARVRAADAAAASVVPPGAVLAVTDRRVVLAVTDGGELHVAASLPLRAVADVEVAPLALRPWLEVAARDGSRLRVVGRGAFLARLAETCLRRTTQPAARVPASLPARLLARLGTARLVGLLVGALLLAVAVARATAV